MNKLLAFFIICTLVAFKMQDNKTTIFLVGDSTMANKPLEDNPEKGWGMYLQQFFNHSIIVENKAVNGRSTKSFIDEGKWAAVVQQIKPGDYVFIQFGHNDEKKEDPKRYADAQGAYKNNLIRFVNDVKKKKGIPVLLSPVARRKFLQNGFVDEKMHGDYPDVVKAVADSLGVAYIDLFTLSKNLLREFGPEASKNLYLWIPPRHYNACINGRTDDTHFSSYGAKYMASLVCSAINELKLPLRDALLKSGFDNKFEYELPIVYEPHFVKDTFNIRQFGAVSDGKTLNTEFIQNAINACNKNGGGVVEVPNGFWMTGPLELKSNVNLFINRGAILQFTADYSAYKLIESNWEGQPAARNQSPISANNAVNIAITGSGIIDGNGDAWRMVKKDKLTTTQWQKLINSGGMLSNDKKTWYPTIETYRGAQIKNAGVLKEGMQLSDFDSIKAFLRPNLLVFTACTNVLLEGVTFQNSPAWCLHPFMCNQLTVRNVYAKNPWYAQNGDGIDIESCSNVLLENSTFDVGDDGICIKSGRDASGRKRNMPTQNALIQNCVVYHAHGGFVIGSEMSGGAKNLYVRNCSFMGTDIGLRFKTVRGRGGVVENIYTANINMKDIIGEAVLFDMYYAAQDPVPLYGEERTPPKVEVLPITEATPVFKNFYINNIVCNGASKAIFVRGIPEMPVQNVVFNNLHMQTQSGIDIEEAKNIQINNCALIVKQSKPLVYILNAENIMFNHFNFNKPTELMVELQGARTKNIQFKNISKQNALQLIKTGFGTEPNVVTVTE